MIQGGQNMECECCGNELVSDSVNPTIDLGNVEVKTQGISSYNCYDCDQQFIEMKFLRYLRHKFRNVNSPETFFINFLDPYIIEDMKKFEIKRRSYSKH